MPSRSRKFETNNLRLAFAIWLEVVFYSYKPSANYCHVPAPPDLTSAPPGAWNAVLKWSRIATGLRVASNCLFNCQGSDYAFQYTDSVSLNSSSIFSPV